MKNSISEIITKAIELQKDEEKIEWLRLNRHESLELILQFALDKRAEWLVPYGPIPFKRNVDNDLHHILYYEAKKLQKYIRNGGYDHMDAKRRLILFIQFLEGLNASDAEMMIKVKDKNIDLDPEVVNTAFAPWHKGKNYIEHDGGYKNQYNKTELKKTRYKKSKTKTEDQTIAEAVANATPGEFQNVVEDQGALVVIGGEVTADTEVTKPVEQEQQGDTTGSNDGQE